jgi:hypothetical protein
MIIKVGCHLLKVFSTSCLIFMLSDPRLSGNQLRTQNGSKA